MNLNNLKNEIILIPQDQPVFIYIGVGTAQGIINQEGILEPTNYHQFPPFLQDLRNQVPNLNLFLVLIDPRQENPPYLVRDYPFLQEETVDEYYSPGLQVFVFRKDVHTDLDDYFNPDSINITETLSDLNAFAVEKGASLLYHDFSGKRNATLAEHFQHELSYAHLDQIVYSLSAREDHGCYFDLAAQTSYYPFRIAQNAVGAHNEVGAQNARPIIKMFNYYKFHANIRFDDIEPERKLYSDDMQPLIDLQKEQILRDIKHNFKNSQISILRQLKQLMANEVAQANGVEANAPAGANAVAPAAPYASLPNTFPKSANAIYLACLEEKNYQLIKEILHEICSQQLDFYARLKNLDISGEDMLQFITADADPYQWNKSINQFM